MNAESTREALDVASLAGDILLASGAEIFRVEETIDRIARAYGVDSSDAFVLSSGIFLTAESGKKQEFARVRHIPLSAARLDKVTAVNQLSREIEEGLHMPKEAKAWLLDIQRMPDKPRWHQVLASGVGSACFCFLFGGDVVDSMVAFLSGFVLYVYLLYLLRGRMSKIATNISGGALVTLIAGRMSVDIPDIFEKVIRVKSTGDMLEAVMNNYEENEFIVKAAAPADYRVKNFSIHKIKAKELSLELEKTPDIAKAVGAVKGDRKLIIFSAETDDLIENARKKLAAKNADMVVANDVTKEGAGFNVDTNIATIITKAGKVYDYDIMPKSRLAEIILDHMHEL